MPTKANVIWTIRELTECLRQRQLNKFDANIGISGKRGNGKSTVAFKILNSFKKDGFIQKKHQVYQREDVIELLSNQKFSFCWDDEAINSGYKRDFQVRGQNDLIKIITNYRDNYNIYCSALPFFYTLDKGLRELIFLHIHVIERGFAVLLMPLEDPIHSQDPWDTINNQKIELKENKRVERNPDLKFRYHKLSTFAGYVYFGDMTEKQKRIYNLIKQQKRQKALETESFSKKAKEETPFIEKLYASLKEGKISRDGMIQACMLNGEKYTSLLSQLNARLTNEGNTKRVQDYLIASSPKERSNVLKEMKKERDNIGKEEVLDAVPEL